MSRTHFRYVLLRHDTSETEFHWDFLFEEATALRTYSVSRQVVEQAMKQGGFHEIVPQRPDHRMIYLQYEGPISNQRGCVHRIDAGEFVWIFSGQTLRFQGELCSGTVEILENSGKFDCEIKLQR